MKRTTFVLALGLALTVFGCGDDAPDGGGGTGGTAGTPGGGGAGGVGGAGGGAGGVGGTGGQGGAPAPLTCDPTGQGEVVRCETLDLIAADCTIFGAGVPIPLDPSATPEAPAFAGVEVNIQPQATINLPASLVCGFAAVLTQGTISNSGVDFIIGNGTPTGQAVDSFVDDGSDSPNLVSPHNPTVFSFTDACGCDPRDPPLGGGPDQPSCETGPGITIPFLPRTTDPAVPGTTAVTPTAAGLLRFSYEYDTLVLPIATAIGLNVCVGGACLLTDGLPCPATDRTGDGDTTDPGDAPRLMYDAECNKIGVLANGGTPCTADAQCPFNASVGQLCDNATGTCDATELTCDNNPLLTCTVATQDTDCVANNECFATTKDFCDGEVEGACDDTEAAPCFDAWDCPAGVSCLGATVGSCVTDEGGTACEEDNDCPPPVAGYPMGCEGYQDYASATLCATGQPGTPLNQAAKTPPCGQDSCTPVGCTGTQCDANSCDQQACCDFVQARYRTITDAQFPVVPVNPAP